MFRQACCQHAHDVLKRGHRRRRRRRSAFGAVRALDGVTSRRARRVRRPCRPQRRRQVDAGQRPRGGLAPHDRARVAMRRRTTAERYGIAAARAPRRPLRLPGTLALPEPDGRRERPHHASPISRASAGAGGPRRSSRQARRRSFPATASTAAGRRRPVDRRAADGRDRHGLLRRPARRAAARHPRRADLVARCRPGEAAARLCPPLRRRRRLGHPHLAHPARSSRPPTASW